MEMRALLEEYRDNLNEARLLTKRLERLQNTPHVVTDTVKGSSHQNPYHERIIPITGISERQQKTYKRVTGLLQKRSNRLRANIVAVEEFINSLTDSRIRQIVECYYSLGMTWEETAKEVYGHATESTPRKALDRFWEKSKVSGMSE